MKPISDFFTSHGIDPFLAGAIFGVVFASLVRLIFFNGGRRSGLRMAASGGSGEIGDVRIEAGAIHFKVGDQARALSADQSSSILAAAKDGQKIEAIRRLREASGLGLKDSKDVVEALESELRRRL